jgi:hypothetical protein
MSVPCSHHDGVRCTLGLFGGRPSEGVCRRACSSYDGPDRGIGDTIARVAAAFGIPKCGACGRRQITLNAVMPFGFGTKNAPEGASSCAEVASRSEGDAPPAG